MQRRAEAACAAGEDLREALIAEASAIWDEDRAMCRRIGELGASLIPAGATVCTVCNAGALATGGMGTALAPVYTAHQAGLNPHVIVPETRPLLQGSRLTAWELTRAGVPCTLIGDGMIASRLRLGDIACVIVGADRIAANGDVANKIGTYGLALAAQAHGIPFYVAAPTSTIDPATPDGAAIPIEQRDSDEVATWQGARTAPVGVKVWNPAFDMTPAKLITGIITDKGIFEPREICPSSMTSVLALDQGTTGSTALVIHQDGTVLGRGYREFTQHYPQPGWVEHDAEEIFRVSVAAMREAVTAAGERPIGLGITNQRETVVLWDRRTLAPVAPAIVWQDRRTTDRCRQLRESGLEPMLRERTGLVADPYFSATKLEWLLRTPQLARRAGLGELAAGTVESWLVAKLSGGRAHVSDHTNASRTLLYDLRRRTWDPELLQLFHVPPEVLPRLVASSGVVEQADAEHLGFALPIAGLGRGSAGGALRAGLRPTRPGQEHLWHRRFPPGAHRRPGTGSRARPVGHGGVRRRG